MAHVVDGDLPDISINPIDNAIISDTNPIPLFSPREFDGLPRERFLLQLRDAFKHADSDGGMQRSQIFLDRWLEGNVIRRHRAATAVASLPGQWVLHRGAQRSP